MRFIFLSIIFTISSTYALVDMQGANFTETFVDLEIADSGYNLRVERAYNSRTLFNGIFGFGMCSNFETKLEKLADGRLKRIECGAGQELDFVAKDFAASNLTPYIQSILNAFKKENSSLTNNQLALLKKRLTDDPLYRDEQGARLKIPTPAPAGPSIYFSVMGNSDKISFSNGYYQRELEDGTLERFDLQGRLITLFDRNKNHLKFDYRKDLLTTITSSSGNRLDISYYQTGKVKEIRGPKGIKSIYKYDKINDLIYVKNIKDEVYEYRYDALHNMTQISYPDKTTKKLSYNQDKDWVTGLVDRDGCVESYNYEVSKSDPKNNFFSSVEKKCKDKVVNKSRYGFWFKDRANKSGTYLSKLTMDINGTTSEITYHDLFEKPVLVKKGKDTIVYTYFNNGLLKSKKTNDSLITYKYNNSGRVTEVREGKNFTRFNYDNKGSLASATNSLGQSVQLNYDSQGRIIRLMDQAKRLTHISYDDKTGKPRTVDRPGVGTIYVTYDNDGNVKEVRSKNNDPTVAVQVASAFNNLLELVTPAGVQSGI